MACKIKGLMNSTIDYPTDVWQQSEDTSIKQVKDYFFHLIKSTN